ncbi:hypothetical protein F5Y07DRAFT_363318 [Xylaria sp. FL0933]|nr:hypothetical protein F5Y07DRAFT_363318 [Xylaria sp. FL0933]
MHSAQPPESFGDDFSSHPASFQMASVNASAYDPLDDIFGLGTDLLGHEPHAPGVTATHGTPDISLDTQRLRAQHNTEGYRDGVTAGKVTSLQAGFDRGFSLGATVGIRAGQLLGLLEGISAALAETGNYMRADGLLSRAAAELNPQSIFTSEFWAPDGSWAYPVTVPHDSGELVYADVADQHPLIAKWSRVASEEAKRWHINQALPILESTESSTTPGKENNDATLTETLLKSKVISRDAIKW